MSRHTATLRKAEDGTWFASLMIDGHLLFSKGVTQADAQADMHQALNTFNEFEMKGGRPILDVSEVEFNVYDENLGRQADRPELLKP